MEDTLFVSARAAADAFVHGVADSATAEAVARRTLRACRESLERLVDGLHQEGFPQACGLQPRASAPRIAAVAAILGARPPRILELFWEEVGGVALGDLRDYGHVAFFARRAIGPAGETYDPLMVDGVDDAWLDDLEGSREEHLETIDEAEPAAGEAERFLIPLAPDHFHKDDISGGTPYGLYLGDDDWVPEFAGGFAWSGRWLPRLASRTPDFVSYLRACVLECAGFPGLFGVAEFEPLRVKLTRGLTPF